MQYKVIHKKPAPGETYRDGYFLGYYIVTLKGKPVTGKKHWLKSFAMDEATDLHFASF